MTDQKVRVLGAVRQSKTRDRAVSPEMQRTAIQGWADRNDGEVAKFTFDLSTSGGTSAFRRKGLGPWLTEPDKIAAWDVLAATKLDRACRDVADYLKLRTWCDRNGKRFVVLNDPELDNSTPAGRAMGTMTAIFAQIEREMAKERNKERYDTLTELGRWTGGRLPYGWRYDRDSGHLVPDDDGTAETLRAMADMAIAGKSQGQIANWLNTSGNLTMIGREWRTDTVRRVLRAPNTAELLGETKAAELQAALKSREQTRGERLNGHMLLRVAFCRACGAPLYFQKKNRPSGGYYRCLKCMTHKRADWVDAVTENSLLFFYGNLELVEYQLVLGDDHQTTIHALERDIDALEKITGTDAVIAAKRAEIEHLRSLPYDPDHWEPVPQGISVAKHWATLDDSGKGSFLRKRNVRVLVDQHNIEFHGGLLAATEDERHLVPITPPRSTRFSPGTSPRRRTTPGE
jgi:DNA invertase Pin-like site-specific DNA recombinase